MKKLLLAANISKDADLSISQVFDVVKIPYDNPSVYELLKGAQGVDAVLCDEALKLGEQAMEILAPTCNIICVSANECSNIDIAAAAKKGIRVCVANRVVTDAVADMAFALILTCGRNIINGYELVQLGRFESICPRSIAGEDISLQTLGLSGADTLSRAMCARAKAFNMKVLYTSENQDEILEEMGARKVTIDELLAFSDFISLNEGLVFDKNSFDRMKKNSVLVNVSNKDLINEEDLIAALIDKKIKGAALDVFSKENEKKFLKLHNCILTPHMGSATARKNSLMIEDAIKNLLDYFDGKELKGIIND